MLSDLLARARFTILLGGRLCGSLADALSFSLETLGFVMLALVTQFLRFAHHLFSAAAQFVRFLVTCPGDAGEQQQTHHHTGQKQVLSVHRFNSRSLGRNHRHLSLSMGAWPAAVKLRTGMWGMREFARRAERGVERGARARTGCISTSVGLVRDRQIAPCGGGCRSEEITLCNAACTPWVGVFLVGLAAIMRRMH